MLEEVQKMIIRELKNKKLPERITGHLVKKKKRGTYQALEESKKIADEVQDSVLNYITQWLTEEIFFGKIKDQILKEIYSQLKSELNSRGFDLGDF